YAQPEFMHKINGMFEGNFRLKFHLALPALNKPDPVTGVAKKSEFGPWMLKAFRVLAQLKGLRGTAFDPFGYNTERKLERRLIADYEKTVEELLAGLSPEKIALAASIAAIPQ